MEASSASLRPLPTITPKTKTRTQTVTPGELQELIACYQVEFRNNFFLPVVAHSKKILQMDQRYLAVLAQTTRDTMTPCTHQVYLNF